MLPFVRIELLRGANREQKQALVADVTSSLVRILGKDPEHIHIVIDEHAEENWGFSGMLTDDFRRSQPRYRPTSERASPFRGKLGQE